MFDEKPEGAATDALEAGGAEEAQALASEGVDDGDANGKNDDKVAIPRHEYNAIREAREREKALREENARLKAEADARRTPPTVSASAAEEVESMSPSEVRAYKARLREAWKNEGNENARIVLKSLEDSEAVRAELRAQRFEVELARIPEDKHAAVKAFMAETGAPTPKIAYQLMRGGSGYETLEQENARLKAALDAAQKGKPEKSRVEDTRIVGVPGGARKPATKDGEPITLAEYHKKMRDDPAQTIADRKAGKFTIKVD